MKPQDKTLEYEVGYAKPPRGSQFKKGQSGNRRGRPRGAKNLTTILEQALGERVVISEHGRRKTATKMEVIFKQLTNKAAQGDHRSIQLLMAYAEKHQPDQDGKPLTVLQLLSAIGPMPETEEEE
jgi:hypothetical protein